MMGADTNGYSGGPKTTTGLVEDEESHTAFIECTIYW